MNPDQTYGANMSGVTNSSSTSDINFDNLYPAIVECFVIILSGYVAGRMNLISQTEAKGINTFVGHFSLPALIFLSMATLDFSVVNWMFLLSILVSKTVVFVSVIIITLIVSRPVNLGKAGIYAIFSTQSNDFALGYPIVAALYQNSHPDYPNYLYLVAPISLVFLNPLGFVLMEIEKRKSLGGEEPHQSRVQVALHIARGVLLNPVVLMTVAGFIGNHIFQHCLPSILEGVLKVLGSAFSATSLFILGLRMVGQIASLNGKGLVVPGILVVVKSIVMPLVTREVVNLLKAGANATETLDLSTYGFLYGTFPTAPGVFVYAGQYNLDVDLIATSMVACTFFSAPIMFVSAKMITLHVTNDTDYLQDLNKFLFNISIVGIISCLWSTVTFLMSKKWKKMPHCMTLCLVISQLVACIGALLWDVLECKHGWQIHLQFIMFTIGVFSTRIWTALLAISLLLLRWRSLCFTLRMRPIFALIGWGIPAALVTILCLLEERESTVKEKTDPNFQYGRTQATTACLVLLCSFVVTALSLVLHQRYTKRQVEYRPLLQEDNDKLDNDDKYSINVDTCRDTVLHNRSSSSREFTVCKGNSCRAKKDDSACCLQDVEDICFNPEDEITPLDGSLFSPTGELCPPKFNCPTTQRQKCSTMIKKYQSYQTLTQPEEMAIVRDRDDEYQVLRHVVLLLLLCLSMIVGFALCMWKLIMEEATGIYVELEFLDGALNFGQGLFVFIIFGLDAKLIVLPFIKWWRKFWYGAETILLPKIEELSLETKQICDQFMTYHYEKCVQDLVRDRRWRMKRFDSVFCGNELVDWLIIVGLARDRSDAIKYGRHLLTGRLIRHTENQHHFFDLPYFYILIPLENSLQQPLSLPSSSDH